MSTWLSRSKLVFLTSHHSLLSPCITDWAIPAKSWPTFLLHLNTSHTGILCLFFMNFMSNACIHTGSNLDMEPHIRPLLFTGITSGDVVQYFAWKQAVTDAFTVIPANYLLFWPMYNVLHFCLLTINSDLLYGIVAWQTVDFLAPKNCCWSMVLCSL